MRNQFRTPISALPKPLARSKQPSEALKQSLRIEQHGAKLNAELVLRPGLSVIGIWLFHGDGEWTKVNSVIHSKNCRSTSFEIDLSETLLTLLEALDETGAVSASEDPDASVPKARSTAYLEVEGPAWAIPKSAQRWAVMDSAASQGELGISSGLKESDETELARGFIVLGRFANTELPTFSSLQYEGHQLTPYVTKKGNIAIALNHPVPPFMRVHVDELTLGPTEHISLRGRIYTRHTSISRLQLQLTARSTDHSLNTPAQLTFNRQETARKYGLQRYTFQTEIPLAKFLESEDTSDDIFDGWMTADVPGETERYRSRVGKNRYLVRRKARPGTTKVGDRGVSVVPYFTMKVKNVSFQVEHFDNRSLALIDQAIAHPNRLRNAARRMYSERPVWLIGEMPFKAQDTGVALFKYIVDHHPEIDAWYVIDLDSPELVNLAGYEDQVVRHRSEEHVLLSLAAERIIGSHHPDYIYPTRRREFIRACHGLEVFLQHGVMGMKWMTKTYGKAAGGFSTDLFLTSSEREKSMIVEDFGYSPDEVKVTGLSRFDSLFDSDIETKPSQVLILPTWRDWLTTTDRFLETRFFEEWHSFLNSPEFLDLCQRFNLDVVFGLHPNMRQYIGEFADSPARVFVQGEVSVQTLIKQSGIMITDYSSAGLDFSFLHKPLLYFQFDRSRFFGKAGSHFDLNQELPGPVSTKRSSLIRQLEKLLSNGTSTFVKYFDRADRLYPFRDQNNRERIFHAISDARRRRSLDKLSHSEPVQIAKNRLRRSKRYFPMMKLFFAAAKRLPMARDTIVFESGLGRQYSDSPRAIYEELVRRGDTQTKVWIYNRNLPFKDPFTIVVKRLSPQYFWYLARAKYWVNNQNFPFYITRRKNGVYLQTWHGTPLKRMQHDLDSIEGRDSGYLDRVTQASGQWSYLLSPSPYATSAFSTAFRHNAEIVEAGYPRNDVLSGPNVHALGDSVREALDLPAGKKVLLYAPTFRDDQNISGNNFGFSLPFDLEQFAANHGDKYVLLLRMHVVVRNKLSIPDHLSAVVRDVSAYDNINELYAASDALITDYSSVFFDYSILGRPIIFYAFDLAKYRDQLRGFYLDYESELPGPIVTSEDELWNAVAELEQNTAELSARSANFAVVYAPHDDGSASERVVDKVFGPQNFDS